ncbi:hypothetical protein [Halomonas alkalicola]|uniref:hypothetical protein n=1 Tax=Halomonas alkalicola TaxID=1930622 RepID=UPI00265DDE2B|nr:hypothetical protein [Halomonas alkalicola]
MTLLKQEFGERVVLDMIIKDNDGSNQRWQTDIPSIDGFLPERYTRDELEALLPEGV